MTLTPVSAVPLPRPAPDAAPQAAPAPAASRRVLFLNWRDRSHPEGGGSEQYVERVAAGLAARGHDVTVFCAAHDRAGAEDLVNGVRYVREGGRVSVYLRAAAALRSGRLGQPDVVVDVQNGVPFCTPLHTRRPVINVVHHVHREQWPVVFGPVVARLGWWLESRIAPQVYRACRYVAVSSVTARELTELGVAPDRISIVHNGADAPLDGSPGRAPTPLVCVLGRLVPHKRVELALRAVAVLRNEMPGLRLALVGEGWWEPRLRAEAATLGVSDIVDFHGFVDEATKHELLARSWVLAQPSVKEGWGLSVVEAAAHGTPAVAFADAGGVAESVRDGETGMLVDSPQEFVAALRRLVTDDVLRRRLGDAARAHALDYTWDGAVDGFVTLLEEVLAAKKR